MWYLILLLLLLAWNVREPFTVHIEGDMPTFEFSKHLNTVTEGIQNYTTRPLYQMVLRNTPYKHHYRKWRRYFKM